MFTLEAEPITHRKAPAGLQLTRGFASQRKSVFPQGLDDSAVVILSKQDKHIRQTLLAGIPASLPLSFVG